MTDATSVEKRTIAKLMRRLIPFLILIYFFAFLDRVNVGFAALTMNREIGLDAYTFGWGAGIFFIGYFLFEVPSNVMLAKVGARRWLARIMISWGILSGVCALVQGPVSFMILRFVLGAAEAGFFPGVILFLTMWFPARYRAQVVALFMLANPLSTALGSIVSGLILRMDGLLGLAGWQWLFVVEGVPSVLLGFVTFFYLNDTPAEARWLDEGEKHWLDAQLRAEAGARGAAQHAGVRAALTNPFILLFGLIYLLVVTTNNGLVLWQPQILKAYGVAADRVGTLNALPFIVGAVAMVFYGRRADRTGAYRPMLALACACMCIGMLLAASTGLPALAFAGLVVAAIGGYCALPAFWAMPTSLLGGTAAAAGIALVNSIGNLGGFAGPYLLGYLRASSSGYTSGLFALALAAGLACLVTLLMRVRAAAGAGEGEPRRQSS